MRPSRHKLNRLLLILAAILTLTACQKTTPFVYDPDADLLMQAERIISGPGIVFDPNVERIVVITAAFNGDGEGVMQEYQMADFGVASVNTVPGGQVVVSVPHHPGDGGQWQIALNEHRISSKTYLPRVFEATEDQSYDRLNFLIEPEFDSDLHFTRLSEEGDQLWTFKVSIRGVTPVQ